MDSIDTLASAGYDRSIKLFKGSAAAADPPVRQQELTASILSFLSKDLVFTYGRPGKMHTPSRLPIRYRSGSPEPSVLSGRSSLFGLLGGASPPEPSVLSGRSSLFGLPGGASPPEPSVLSGRSSLFGLPGGASTNFFLFVALILSLWSHFCI